MAVETLAIVQARMGSTRLPGKVMKKAVGKPMIQHLLERLSRSELIDEIVIAISDETINDPLENLVERLGYAVYRGSEYDVLDRYYQVALQYDPEIVVRITGDCPLICYEVTDKVIEYFINSDYDYVYNTGLPPSYNSYPGGLDTEVFYHSVLNKTWNNAIVPFEREHVTPYMRKSGLFKIGEFICYHNLKGDRWELDYPEDLKLIRKIFEKFNYTNDYFGFKDILKYKDEHPEVFQINKNIAIDSV